MARINPLSLDFLAQKPSQAAVILQQLSSREATPYLEEIPIRILAPVIEAMERWPAAQLLEHMSVDRNSALLHQLHYQSTMALVRLFDKAHRNAVVERLPTQRAQMITRSLTFSDHTVGAWADSSAPEFSEILSVADTLTLIKKMQQPIGPVIPLVNPSQQIVGVVPTERLIHAAGEKRLGQLAERQLQPLDALMSLSVAAESCDWQRFSALPVRSHGGAYLGVLRRESLVTALKISRPVATQELCHSLTAQMFQAMLVCIAGLLDLINLEQLANLVKGANDEHHR